MATLRNVYQAWLVGAGLYTDDVIALAQRAGIPLSRNRIREFTRDSDRASTITVDELHGLITAWADERRAERARSVST